MNAVLTRKVIRQVLRSIIYYWYQQSITIEHRGVQAVRKLIHELLLKSPNSSGAHDKGYGKLERYYAFLISPATRASRPHVRRQIILGPAWVDAGIQLCDSQSDKLRPATSGLTRIWWEDPSSTESRDIRDPCVLCAKASRVEGWQCWKMSGKILKALREPAWFLRITFLGRALRMNRSLQKRLQTAMLNKGRFRALEQGIWWKYN